jgi:hypothetical protein
MPNNNQYSLKDFREILFQGFDVKLSEETMKIINDLASQVGSPNYIKTPVFQKIQGGRKKEKEREREWKREVKKPDEFRSTQIQKNLTDLDTIRLHLNKLSDKNYQEIKQKVIHLLDTMEVSNNGYNGIVYNGIDDSSKKVEKSLKVVSEFFFEIASTNRFYSKLYADLLSELVDIYDVFKEVLISSFSSFLIMFDDIKYVDPDKNYDEYCLVNKENEKRRALSAFFVNLTENGLIMEEHLIQVICQLFRTLHNFISIEGKKNQVDEITENIAILCQPRFILKSQEIILDSLTILAMIQKFAKCKTSMYPSITNKTIFKFMDILDAKSL